MRLRIRIAANGESEDLAKSFVCRTSCDLSGCHDRSNADPTRRNVGTRDTCLVPSHGSTTEIGMGGYGSTRWGWRSTRATTDEFPALDVRALARRGYFSTGPGELAVGTETWCCDGKEVGRVDVLFRGDELDAMTLEYVACQTNGNCHVVREQVRLDRTHCTLGGSRPWFVCSGCRTRRAVLFCVGGVFRCRACHDLAYRSTREKPVSGGSSAALRVSK
jgi:hypothetical protein